MNRRETRKKAFFDTLPVMAGYLVLGAAFGILMVDRGYSVLWALTMSTLIYAGSMQFAAVDLLSGGASLLSAALMTLLVNARHVLYGISMLERYRGKGREKPYLIFGLTDETYALVCGGVPEGADSRHYDLTVTLLNQLYWVAGTALGSLLGTLLTFNTAGIDFAMTALFVVIYLEQLREKDNRIPAVIGVAASLLCLLLFGRDAFLIPSMVLITASLCVLGAVQGRRDAPCK